MMSEDYPSYRCRWVRVRLPLLAGGELTGSDRRQVERHLIACEGCRGRERSLSGALSVLKAVAAEAPVDPPALWPALARQIRESRHEPVSWLDAPARFVRPLTRCRPGRLLAASLMVAASTALMARNWSPRPGEPASAAVAAPSPIDEFEGYDTDPIPAPVLALEPPPALTPKALARDDAPTVPAERTASRFDYDLDHGTPLGANSVDVKASY